MDAITEVGRDEYELDRDGVSPRRWTTDLLDLLTGKGWATTSDAEAAKRNITKLCLTVLTSGSTPGHTTPSLPVHSSRKNEEAAQCNIITAYTIKSYPSSEGC
jgi:hypothetical protein